MPASASSTDDELPTSDSKPRRSGWRRWLFRLVAVGVGSVAVLVALEISIRLFAPQPTHFYSFADFNLPDGTLRPGARGMLCGVPVEVNVYGERGPVYAHTKPPGTYRICVIGDSIVFGLGVRDDERYPRVLERMLRKRHGHDRIEVIPFGQVHYHISAYRERLLPKALSFNPDLLLIGFVLNDFEPPPNRTTTQGVSGPRRHGVAGYTAGIKRLTAELRKYSHLVYLVRKQTQIMFATTLMDPDELIEYWELACMYPESDAFRQRWAYTIEQLDDLHAMCRERGIKPMIAVTPFDLQMNADRLEHYRGHLANLPDSCLDAIPQRMLDDYAKDRDIDFVDMTTRFKSHPRQVFFQVLEGRTDLCHPNAEGHRLMAEILADRLGPIIAQSRL